MITTKEANYIINITLHVLILFTFLTIFFFVYASKLAKKTINKSLTSIVNDKTKDFLNEIDKWDEKLNPNTYPNIKWKEINELSQKLKESSQSENPKIVKNNYNLKLLSIAMIAGLLLLFIGLYLYYRFFLNLDVNLGHIFIENIVIFAFVGAIEAYFFMNIASKYIPTTPDFVETTILERIKNNIKNKA